MNAPERIGLPDIQSQHDTRNIEIDAVGVKDLRHPVLLRSHASTVPTIGTFTMTVALPAAAKGTHMSRFVELLEMPREALDQRSFERLVADMLARLDADRGTLEMRFPWFRRKPAPVSGAQGLVDYDVTWRGTITGRGEYAFTLRVAVPATSLCPCSKEISAYGAHNQRSTIVIAAELAGPMSIDDLIGIAERSASCEVYGLLKRQDEKYVTERAYNNPRFVEDLVRDVAVALDRDARVASYVVEAENFESIHNHSAFARIARRARG